MTDSATGDKPGLRERKKAKTKAAIQEHALRLFREQGYENTTVDQIAEAAEVSPSTFFRYFGSKVDVVVYDVLDPIFVAALQAQPAELSPLRAMRAAMKQALAQLGPDYMNEMTERGRLVFKVPELREAMVDDTLRTVGLMTQEMARRCGRSPDDPELRIFVGALIGAIMAAIVPELSSEHPDFLAAMDPVIDFLEKGMPL